MVVVVVVVVSQEEVVKSLEDHVVEQTLNSFTLADNLTTNLITLNVLIEGTRASCQLPF